MRGSKRTEKAKMVHALAMGGSTREEGLPDDMMGIVFGLIGKSFDHDRPKLNDLRWTRTWELAVTQRVKARLHGPTSPAVLVLGLGTAVPPLAAARAGARVLWCLRVRRFYEIAARVVEVNGLHNQIQVLHRREAPSALGAVLGPQFDIIVSEDVESEMVGDIVPAVHTAARALLKPGGEVIPSGATLKVVAAEIRCTEVLIRASHDVFSQMAEQVSGFDLRIFNRFRNDEGICVCPARASDIGGAGTFYDLSDVAHTLLNEPASFEIDFNHVSDTSLELECVWTLS